MPSNAQLTPLGSCQFLEIFLPMNHDLHFLSQKLKDVGSQLNECFKCRKWKFSHQLRGFYTLLSIQLEFQAWIWHSIWSPWSLLLIWENRLHFWKSYFFYLSPAETVFPLARLSWKTKWIPFQISAQDFYKH